MAGDVAQNILIIEDDDATRLTLRGILERDGHRVEVAATMAEALDRQDWSAYETILMDRRLPDGTSAELLPQLRRLAPAAAVIVVTGHADVAGAIEALRQGAVDYLIKPIELDELRSRLRRIAEHRRLEQAHRESERFVRSVLDSLGAKIAVLDHSGMILAVNQEWRAFATANGGDGTHLTEGANYLETCAQATGEGADTARAFAAGIRDVLAGRRESFELEFPCQAPDQCRWFVGRVTPFQGEGARKVVVAHVDITERKESVERALRSERLAAIGQMVTVLTHESRNALQRVQANLELLTQEARDQPRALELLERQQRALDDLERLHEEVRGYAAPIRLDRRPCELPALWRVAWDELGPKRAERRAEIREDIACSDPSCQIDPHRIRQVFRNLLENALAACDDPAEIAIACVPAVLDGQTALRISVRDNGPGFTLPQRKKAFEPFSTTKTKGTGLGLAICRRIMEAHGGRILLGDHPGPGAEFLLDLPRGALEPHATA